MVPHFPLIQFLIVEVTAIEKYYSDSMSCSYNVSHIMDGLGQNETMLPDYLEYPCIIYMDSYMASSRVQYRTVGVHRKIQY